jgi:hypothetical protein
MEMSSFTWLEIGELARNQGAKKIQVGTSDVKLAQFTQSRMYTYYPWRFSLVETAYGQIPLIQGVQDYPAPSNMYRLTRAWITVTYPGSVDQNYELNVVDVLTPDLNPTGFYGNGEATFMKNFGIIRMANAVQNLNQPNPAYLNLEYQPIIPKITDMGMNLCFPDEYSQIAVEGYLYWLYKFGDDERAGTMVKEGNNIEYTGQLAIFESQLFQMAGTERAPQVSTMFPSDTMGTRWWGERAPLGPWW